MARPASHVILIVVAAAAAAVTTSLPAVPQDPAYHAFADRRTIAGVPNALNVLSNVAFLVAGWYGLAATLTVRAPLLRRAYAALFLGTVLTGFGSAWYHLSPRNATLVWDRLPMTIGFMGLLTAVVGERVSGRAARTLFLPLLALGAFSVAYWGWSEARGAGDLRLYVLVQFGSLAVVVLMLLLYRVPQARSGYLMAALAAYGVAKVCEAFDAAVYSAGQIVSGHTLKHVVAASALGLVALMLRRRAAC